MPPFLPYLLRRTSVTSLPSDEFLAQWTHPSDVFSVLLILGGDVVGRALAQLAGTGLTPVTFSFGWVAYSTTALVSAIGENKLMPLPDCACKVINGKSGYVRDNSSWIIGRVVRDFESWMDPQVSDHLAEMLKQKWNEEKAAAERKRPGSGKEVERPKQAGLCIAIYRANEVAPGNPEYDAIYYSGFLVTTIQLAIAAIPCGLFDDWGILLVTVSGILLSYATGSLPQWAHEKWACRWHSDKWVALTRGNGSQHVIVIMGDGRGLDLEDLAAGPTNVGVLASQATRVFITGLAILWILLLITAAGIRQNTWFLLAVGSIGIVQNVVVAGWRRNPRAFGLPLSFHEVYGETKVMATLFAVEKKYPRLGRSLLDTFFPGGNLHVDEAAQWSQFDALATAQLSGQAVSPSSTT